MCVGRIAVSTSGRAEVHTRRYEEENAGGRGARGAVCGVSRGMQDLAPLMALRRIRDR